MARMRGAALLVLGSVVAGAVCIATPAVALGPVDTTLISGALSGAPNGSALSPSMSSDGRYVAFESDADNLVAADTNDSTDVFVRDMLTGTTTRVSIGYDGSELAESSYSPKLSADAYRTTPASP